MSDVSDCACTETLNRELNKELLKVFLGDNERSQAEDIDTELNHLPRFSVFNERHMRIAHDTAQELSELDVNEMIEKLSDLKNRHSNSAHVDYLARIALFKHQDTKNMVLPPAYQTRPRAFFHKDHLLTETSKPFDCSTATDILGSPTSLNPEHKLAWWREDPGVSEHHSNWHVYYPVYKPIKDRQGELFAYMHEQMLARYNFERLAVGLSPVTPYGPGIGWDDPLPEGFNGNLVGFSPRASWMNIPNGVTMDSHNILTSDMRIDRERLIIAIARNYLEGPTGDRVELTMHKLGCTVEADDGSVNKKLYGNIHNNGHIVIGKVNDPDGRYEISEGPMYDQYTAARDPVFYRWHKFVDSIFEAYRTTEEPYKEHDLKMDGIKVESISVICDHSNKQLAKYTKIVAVNQLYTRMMKKAITIYRADHKPQELFIDQTVMQYFPFTYYFKVSNTGEEDETLVFRVFLAPIKHVTELDQRRNDFIEMDRFVAVIKSESEKTITRSSEQSSVLMPPSPTLQDIRDGNIADSQGYCGCGWPRNLLLPRGTPSGMTADFYVLVTNWKDDAVNPDAQLSGNVAYCGKKDSLYPDKKPMGFPFDRPMTMSIDTLDKMVKGVPNSAKTEVTITFLGNEVSG